MNSRTYDFLKQFTQVYLPALGTLYFALAGIWGLPYGEQIVGTITALDTFLGVCLHISTKQYNAQLDEDLDFEIAEEELMFDE